MRKPLLLGLILFVGLSARSQVKGTVIDSAAKKPLDKAVIGLVVKSNPADTIYTFTDDKGQFRFDDVPSSAFSVVIRNMGFRPYSRYVAVTKKERTIDVGTLILAQWGKLMDEVVVIAPAIIIKEDTVEYNAGSFKVKENAVVEDL